MTLRVIPVVFMLSMLTLAQQPKPRASSAQGSLGTVQDNRKATLPRTSQTSARNGENELVGCVSQQGEKYVLMQPRERRWYELRGDKSQLQSNVGKMVKVTGKLELSKTSAFDVRQVQKVQDKCQLEATASPSAATGKTGVQGKAEPVTSTATVEQVTPGVQTQRGISQDPAKGGHNPGATPRPTESQAAPPDPNIQNPDEARRIANAAQQSELSDKAPLGVTAHPNYSNANNPQANAQAVDKTAQQERGQASGSEQVFKGGEKQIPDMQRAQSNQSPGTPILTGCLSQEGNQYWLAEQGGSRVRLSGDDDKLKDHVNHTVQVVGRQMSGEGPAVGASTQETAVQVQAIQDVAPTCQKQ